MGAYFAYYTLDSNVVLGITSAFFTAFFLGALLYLLIKKIGDGIFEATIISLGFAIGLEEILRIVHGRGYYLIVESNIVDWELMQAVLLVILLSSLFVAYSSRIGIKLKFVEDDDFLAIIYGVNYERYSFLCITLTSAVIGLLGFLSSTSLALYPGIGWVPLIAGIIIAALTAVFRSVGFMHYGKIVVLSFVYSFLVALLFR
jgi:branched-subunit amino acid ABC-type transport system permease component